MLSFVRNALVGPAAWIAILAAAIVVPILAITTLFVSDIERLTSAALAERAGIADLVALDHVFHDASDYRAGRACGGSGGSVRAIERDVAAMNALESQRPILGNLWTAASAAWIGAGDPLVRAGRLVNRISPLFVTVSDRSGVTYDPEVAGIDLADALAYRLPRALDGLQRIELSLCADANRSTTGSLVSLALVTGETRVLLADAYGGDIGEAVGLDRSLPPVVRADLRRALVSTGGAFALLADFQSEPRPPQLRLARAATAVARRVVYELLDNVAPSLDRIALHRIAGLRRRFYLTLVPGLLAMVAGALFVLLGARSVLQRAELSRITRNAEELAHHAAHDGLTQLPNRAAFVTALERTIGATAETSGEAAVLFIDLDDFKLVNDSLGHAAGDTVLRAVADRLATICRDGRAEIVARFGGDEFAMLVRDADAAGLRTRIERIVGRIAVDLAQPVALGADLPQRIGVSASVGIAALDAGALNGTAAADVLRDADVAMYEAKARGRAGAVTFGPAMRERAVRKLHLQTDLRGAAERGELALARESIVRLADGRTVGTEALLRWHHPRLGVLAPDTFLPMAEESGAIVSIGRWALATAVAQLAASPRGFAHVNLSVANLTDESLLETVASLLARHKVAPGELGIEITEGSLVRSGGRAEAMLAGLRDLGVRIWIDDFGVEYSSLRYLDRLPITGVKIDRSFVGGGDGGLASPTIVKMIVDLARSLDLDVVAEGIETAEQRDALHAIGCTYGQGYLFSHAAARRISVHGDALEPRSVSAEPHTGAAKR